MIPVSVTIQYVRAGNKETRRVTLMMDSTVKEAINSLIRELGLSSETSGLQLVRQRIVLPGDEKLFEAGVQENDILQLTSYDANATMTGRGISGNMMSRMGGKTSNEPLPVHAALVAVPGGQTFWLRHTRAMVGRADASVGYPADVLDADLTSLDPDRSVSRPHALIVYSSGTFTIRDMYSQQGILLNGTRIPVNTAHPLRNGDRLQFGTVTMQFNYDS